MKSLSERTSRTRRAGSEYLDPLSYFVKVSRSNRQEQDNYLLLLTAPANCFMYRRSTVIAIWSLLAAGAVYLFVFEPGRSGFFPICPFRFLTGFTCPGCGTTRALHQILHGHILTAFTLNPLF